MSDRLNQELSSWKAVLVQLRRIETSWRGHSLSQQDHETYTEAILMSAMVLNDLSNRYEGLGTLSDHRRFATKVAHVDVSLLASFLSEAIVLWRHLSSDDFHLANRSYDGFKRHLSRVFPFAGDFLGPVKGCIEMYLKQPDPLAFRLVYQHLSFLNHLTLVDIDLSDELELGYIEHEEMLALQHLPDGFIDEMNRVMRIWLSDFRIDEASFMPKHGPGSVAELHGDRSLVSKYQALKSDALIDYVFRKYAGVQVSTYFPIDSGGFTPRQSRTIFVPKSMKTKRTISMEPSTLQYLQQGVDSCIREYVRSHTVLRTHIDLNDQCKQQEEAMYASKTRQLATVDLSAASDSVSWSLAKRVFAGTALLPFLWALRSSSTLLPSGKVLELTKFAPMGSALCFPIQTLIFACICECTCRYVQATTGPFGFRYRVYGDDIIIPDRCLDDLVSSLRWCGFTINEAKTYGGNYRFRESCGCDAYDGVDVTPLRISRKFSAGRITSRTPGAFSAIIDLVNATMDNEFLLLRRYLIDKLINGTKFVPLFSEDGLDGVRTSQPSNFRLPERVNEDYQRSEVQAARIVSYHSPDRSRIKFLGERRGYVDDGLPPVDSDCIRYFERLRNTNNSVADVLDPEHPASRRGGRNWTLVRGEDLHEFRPLTRIGAFGTYLTNRWVEDPNA